MAGTHPLAQTLASPSEGSGAPVLQPPAVPYHRFSCPKSWPFTLASSSRPVLERFCLSPETNSSGSSLTVVPDREVTWRVAGGHYKTVSFPRIRWCRGGGGCCWRSCIAGVSSVTVGYVRRAWEGGFLPSRELPFFRQSQPWGLWRARWCWNTRVCLDVPFRGAAVRAVEPPSLPFQV